MLPSWQEPLHGLDAITLSTAQSVYRGEVEPATGWRVILTAALSNLAVNVFIAGCWGRDGCYIPPANGGSDATASGMS